MISKSYNRSFIYAIVFTLVVVKSTDAAMSMEQIQKTAMTMRNTCATKVNADIDVVAGIQNGQFPDDRPLKCYTHCIMKTLRTFKNGRVDNAMMNKQVDIMMPPDLAAPLKEVIAKCAAETAPTGDDCETTFQFVKCEYETDPSTFFFP